METFALLSVPWVALKLAELVETPQPTGGHLFTTSFWVILLIPAEIILLFELLASFCTWLGAMRLQRLWFHLLDGKWHGGCPTLDVSFGDGHVSVVLTKYGSPTDKVPRKSIISWALALYREFTPIDGRHELGDVTMAVWGEGYALLLLGGRSRLFDTATNVRLPAPRARITPAVPIGLARMQEADRQRLRRMLEERHIPIREVHDEGWARRALRAIKAQRRERSQ